MNQLAESVLGLSDEAILAETSEAGADPQREAERTRLVLRQASKALDNVNKRLSDLGHTINSNDWRRGQWGYHNTCVTCGSFSEFHNGNWRNARGSFGRTMPREQPIPDPQTGSVSLRTPG